MSTQTPLTTFETILKRDGYSLTAPRRRVFELLLGQEPLSMHELTARAADDMDRASVYRTIEVFERLGIVRRINIGWKYKLELSDAFTEHHHHLTCVNCHRIIPINERALEGFIDTLSKDNNFTPTDHQIEIQGYCTTCKVRNN